MVTCGGVVTSVAGRLPGLWPWWSITDYKMHHRSNMCLLLFSYSYLNPPNWVKTVCQDCGDAHIAKPSGQFSRNWFVIAFSSSWCTVFTQIPRSHTLLISLFTPGLLPSGPRFCLLPSPPPASAGLALLLALAPFSFDTQPRWWDHQPHAFKYCYGQNVCVPPNAYVES